MMNSAKILPNAAPNAQTTIDNAFIVQFSLSFPRDYPRNACNNSKKEFFFEQKTIAKSSNHFWGALPFKAAHKARLRGLSAEEANFAIAALSPDITLCSTLQPGHSRNAW